MGGEREAGGQRRIDAAAKAQFLAALHRGERREDAAAGAGFSLTGFYAARYRDPAFAARWKEALADSAAAERRRAPRPEGGETRIVPVNRRLYQRRFMRQVRFDQRRREIFLAHFAWSADLTAAAVAAGVSESTVTYHRRTDPAFDSECREALDRAYLLLEAEALRQRLEAQRRLRAAMDASGPLTPPEDVAEEFERVMKLLARWDRKPQRPQRDAAPGGPRRAWTFDAAIALLDSRLQALDIAVPDLPPSLAAPYDGPDTPEVGEGPP